MAAVTSLLSCSHPKLGAQTLELENFNLNFQVDQFYTPTIEKAKLYSAQREEILAGKKEKDFGDKLVDPWSFETVAIDSVFDGDIFSAPKRLIGLQYNMKSWTQGDTLARYGQMNFEAINMMRAPEGKFIALVATNENEGEVQVKRLIADIERKNGKPQVSEHEFFGGYKVYCWQLKDRLLAISSKFDDKSNELKLAVDLDSMKVDTTRYPAIATKLFIISNEFRDSVGSSLNSGAWVYFDELNKK